MAQKISQMTEQTTASMTEAGTSDFLGGYTTTGGNANRKFSLSGLANYFLNKFKVTLGGSSQTVKSAIDALNSKNVLYNTGVAGSDAATFLKNYLTHATLPSDLTPVIFGGSWENVGYVTGIIRKVTASAFNGIMKVSLTTAGTSKEYSFWSWNGTDVYADQIPTRAEVDALNSNNAVVDGILQTSNSFYLEFPIVDNSAYLLAVSNRTTTDTMNGFLWMIVKNGNQHKLWQLYKNTDEYTDIVEASFDTTDYLTVIVQRQSGATWSGYKNCKLVRIA